MRVAISGSHGLIGSSLTTLLETQGYEVLRLVRGIAQNSNQISLNLEKKTLDIDKFKQIDAVINLAGAGIGESRWNEKRKQCLLNSRVQSTQTLINSFSIISQPPSVLINASAIGYYGNRGDTVLDESSPKGSGFLADLCENWETTANGASQFGTRVVLLRTAMVLSTKGGALARQLPIFKAGLGGKMGSGHQWTSWISLYDTVHAIKFLLENPSAQGPFNLSSPKPVTNTQYSHLLGKALHRPTLITTPKLGLSLLFGSEAVEEFILSSQRAIPKKLTALGFNFIHNDLKTAFSDLLQDTN